MKKIFITLLTVILSMSAYSQDNAFMHVHKGTGMVEIITGEVDSIAPKLGASADLDSLYIYKNDLITHRFRINEIDSIVFRSPAEMRMQDSLALVALYHATDGANWTNNTNWLSNRPIDEWYGVGCSPEGRVSNLLYLFSNNLTGNIPPEIGKLTQLTVLGLESNNLTGNIPPEIWEMTQLTELYLGNNKFSIVNIPPEIGNLTQLTVLDLGWSNLTGNIPPEIWKLKKLNRLILTYNNLTGNIPPEIGQLTQLQYLWLNYNNLTGNIPPEIGNLTQLTYLFLDVNNLTGNIPEELANLSNLSTLYLVGNRLTGQIPTAIVQHPNFDEWLWTIVPQQQGYGFERLNPPPQVQNGTLINQDGDTIVAHTFFANHKLTVLLDWASWCPFSAAFIPILKEQYDYYHDKGLGVLSFSVNDDQEAADAYRTANNMTWDNFYPIEGNYTNRIPYLPTWGRVPNVHIVNQKGEVLWSELLWDNGCDRYVDVPKLIASILGEMNPVDLYESTDYSKDGEALTLQTKTVGKGVNFVLVGDGYVDKDMGAGGKYETVMKEAMEHLFSVEPLKSYREYFNVYAVKAVSKNEGIGLPRETAFSSAYGTGTTVSGNDAAVATYAEKVPGINLTQTPVLVVLNSPAYAGTTYTYSDGSSIAYCPNIGFDSKSFSEVVHHELLGHAFGRLLDEYIYNNTAITPEYIQQFNDFRTLLNMGYNLTLNPADLPWQHIIGQPGYGMVGSYEGGYFFTQGVWRSEENSCMNDNVAYFSAISRELMVKRILETAGETFTWEKFVAKDKYEPVLKSPLRAAKQFVPLAPPVFVKGSLRTAK